MRASAVDLGTNERRSGGPATWVVQREVAIAPLRAGIIFLIILLGLTGCSSPAVDAYESTGIFGSSRELISYDAGLALRFSYRGGTVIYVPYVGSRWIAQNRSVGTFISSGRSADLPNACLLYACERAEEIRLRPRNGESGSQVIAYARADGGGHAFVVYRKNCRLIAEDNLGFRIELPGYRVRSPQEALRLATLFHTQTARRGYPVAARFLGDY